MFKKSELLLIHTISPLHAGSGEALGIVDLPIQRERHTGFPKIESSSLKGAVREAFEDCIEKINGKSKDDKPVYTIIIKEELKEEPFYLEDEKELSNLKDSKYHQSVSLTFGPEEGNSHAGALGFTDARILFFPVKSMKGVFAWITCPMVLERFKEDMELCSGRNIEIQYDAIQDSTCLIHAENTNYIQPGGNDSSDEKKIILEEYCFTVKIGNIDSLIENLPEYTGITGLKQRLVILSDNDFKDFINLSTEVITRTKISAETGTVVPGALFTEEYLPSETVLYSLVLATPLFVKDEKKGIFKKDGNKEEGLVLEFFKKGVPEVIQIGGNATIGKGIVRIINNKGGKK